MKVLIEVVSIGDWDIKNLTKEILVCETNEDIKIADYLLGVDYSKGFCQIFLVTNVGMKIKDRKVSKNIFLSKVVPKEYFPGSVNNFV